MKPYVMHRCVCSVVCILCVHGVTFGRGIDQNDKTADPMVFKDQGIARKHYKEKFAKKDAKWNGATSTFGGSVSIISTTETQWVNAQTGEYMYSTFSWTQYSRTSCGSVLAVPEKEYRIDELFYYGNNVTGIVVSVGVSVCGGGGNITDLVKKNAIKNLMNSGMAVRGGKDNKSGKLLSLKRSSKERFGAASTECYLDGGSGRVFIILWGCNFSKGKNYVTPLSME